MMQGFIKNIFHSPLYKHSHKLPYFHLVHEGELELIFLSELYFMCIYTWFSEVYCYQKDTSQLLLVHRNPITKQYTCKWITSGDIAHDRAYHKISESTFTDFASRYALLNLERVRNSTPQFHTMG